MKNSTAIEDAIATIFRHPRVSNVRTRQSDLQPGVIVTANIDTDLPSTWKAKGVSPAGVRATEEVEIFLPVEFPHAAALPSLRPDFNAKLPHINPHKPGDRIPPCIMQGSLLEAVHAGGIALIMNQLVSWLEKAGQNTLINPDQGWEPMRRDSIDDNLEIDANSLPKDMPPRGGLQLLDVQSGWRAKEAGSYAFLPTTRAKTRFYGADLRAICERVTVKNDLLVGPTLLAICWPTVEFDGSCLVCDQYMPDTIQTYEDLLKRASEYDCGNALNLFTDCFNGAAADLPWKIKLPVYIALAVKRPLPLIGMTSEFEFLVYRVNAPIPVGLTSSPNLTVSPVCVRMPISSDLLRRTSGIKSQRNFAPTMYVGCGSLGSKIVMHTARAGYSPAALVDNGRFEPHNVARHVFHPENVLQTEPKAKQMASLVFEYDGKMPPTYSGSIQSLPMHAPVFSKILHDPEGVVVNTTASIAVRHFLAEADFKARVIEACAMNLGDIGILTVEGQGRNPSTTDIMAYAYEKLRASGTLSVPEIADENLLQIGVGCNSVTLPMSDARISLLAAGAGQAILTLYEHDAPLNGSLSLAVVSKDDMSVHWNHYPMEKTHTANLNDTGGWEVRVLEAAHRKILDETARYPAVETGGLIVGRLTPLSRKILITDVLEAPPDSQRSASNFILGVIDRAKRISEYDESGKGVLWCLGTWHSHLGQFGPSTTDISTADMLEGELKGAAVLLIRRPDGYSAVVRSGKAYTEQANNNISFQISGENAYETRG